MPKSGVRLTDIKKGAVYSIACSAAVGLQVVFSKLALANSNPTTCAAYLITFAVLFSLLGARGYSLRQPDLRTAPWVMLHSVLAMVGIVFSWQGINQLNATVAAFVSRTEVIVSIGLAVIFLNERITTRRLSGFMIGIAGVLMMTWPTDGFQNWWKPGLAYMLIAAVGFGSCEIFGKKAIKNLPIPVFVLYRNTLICILFWCYLIWSKAPTAIKMESLAYVSIAALLGPFLARYFFMHSLQFLPLSVSVGLNQSQPIFTAIFGSLVGFTLPSAIEWFGGIVIIGGCLCLLTRPKLSEAIPEPLLET